MAQGVERVESPRPGGRPAIAELRGTPGLRSFEIRQTIASVLTDMNVSKSAVQYLFRQKALSPLFANLGQGTNAPIDLAGIEIALGQPLSLPGQQTYDGSLDDNVSILQALPNALDVTKTGPGRLTRETAGFGTTGYVSAGLSEGILNSDRELGELQETPIVIIGAGIAGLTSALMLNKLGFSNITILDETGKPGGLWQEEAAQQIARNNPSANTVFGVNLEKANDTGEPSGHEMLDYAQRLYGELRLPRGKGIRKGKVVKVEVGDYDRPANKEHTVIYTDGSGRTHRIKAPIVISATGNGEPLSPQAPGKMETNDLGEQIANPNWQELMDDTKLQQLAGKKLLFVGLGNTTIQAIQRINAYNATIADSDPRKETRKISYIVASHYPFDDLIGDNPAVFRNSRKLSGIAGNLQSVRDTYSTMLEHTYSSVDRWEITRSQDKYNLTLITHERTDDGIGTTYDQQIDAVYSFVGYGQSTDTLAAMGLTPTTVGTDPRVVPADWNGEFQLPLETPNDVGPTIKGFMGVGGILKGYVNPNAETVSGINYQVMFGTALTAVLRAAEFHGMTKGWPALEPPAAAPTPYLEPEPSAPTERDEAGRELVGGRRSR